MDQSFRDSVATISEKGSRNFLFPKKPKGRYTNRRQMMSYVLLAIFFSLPFIKIGGQPFLMLNVLERKFVIFGQIFWPEDFFIFVIAMITGVLFVAVFTVAFGRLFCGWICPQTIFMEHVFRRIEYWIDGDRNQQLRLARMPWNGEKIRKRVIKNGIFYAISFTIANFFLMYIIGKDAWFEIVSDAPSEHLGGLSGMLIFSGVFFFVFAWFREQACIIVCPYGRLQGAMLDRNSVVIAYDYLRGEKRGKFRKSEDRKAEGKGDCIDCNQCVDVCPTGIDIRNGTQLECINCTACIDACDNIMDKTNKPRGLIRYDSENNIASGTGKIFTGRVKAYMGILVVLLSIFTYLLMSRADVESIFLRVPGQPLTKVDEDTYSNAYNFKLLNKTAEDKVYQFKVIEPTEGIRLKRAGESELIEVKASELAQGAVILYLDTDQMTGMTTDIKIGVYDGDELVETLKTSFTGPFIKPKK
ncbi:cytochrome c oxidase accessory protein CcoG [Croceimicrobium hydrocarbonivorans]|uniref:Cytochrome c oxidase accessory protein CcoG n=2 Tax=Croceimicrobium hydrocarbonivorans TaxID=2761580 RepID=A0A7H0VJX5_9FLAO|nr:cytochrome c oxidase accessory protein CcoG [Croceimicrobium hydrocarbonivorans]